MRQSGHVGLAAALFSLGALTARGALGPRYGGELRVGVLEPPGAASPGALAADGAATVAALVHETLVGVDPDGIPLPALASRWTAAADGREWQLEWRDDLVLHDGRPITAEVVVRSLRRFLRDDSPAAARFAETLDGGALFRARRREELPGLAGEGRRVRFRLTGPHALPLAPLAAPAAAIRSESGAGCGPFVPTSPLAGGGLVLTAFPSHARGRPFLDSVALVPFGTREALAAALSSGRADAVVLRGDSGPPASILLLTLDPRRSSFDRPEVRAAVAAALLPPALGSPLFGGTEPRPWLLPPPLLAPIGERVFADPGRLSGSIDMTVAAAVPPLLSQRVVAVLAEAGLRVAAHGNDTHPSPHTDARLWLWSPEVAEPYLALRELAALASPAPEVEQALVAAGAERNLDRRRALLYRAEVGLREQDVLVPLAAVPIGVQARPGVHGLRIGLAGRPSFEDGWLEP